MAFDVDGAKQAGYSDAEIADHLAGTSKFDAEGARKAGYSDQEIISRLAAPHPSAPATESGETPTVTQPPGPAPAASPSWDRQGALADVGGRMVQGTMPGLAVQAARTGYDVVTGLDPKKIGTAAAEGYRETKPLVTPYAEGLIKYLPFGTDINDLFRVGGGILGGVNALAAGGSEAIIEGADAAGYPGLGRDINMGLQVAPMAHFGTGVPRPPSGLPGPRVNPLVESFDRMDAARAAETAPPDRSWPLRFGDEPPPGTPAPGPTPEPPPVPPAAPGATLAPEPPPIPSEPTPIPPREPPPIPAQTGADQPPPVPPPPVPEPPGPRSAGAAASRDMTDPAYLAAKSPAQALTDFTTSVQQTVRDRSRPGEKPGTIEDHNVYVPGVTRLESARVFDPDIAGDHDVMRDIDPAYRNASDAVEQRNHDILKDKYQRMEGDGNSVDALKQARRDVSPEALGVFENERPVSAQPVLDLINEIRASPTGKIEAVTNTLNRIEKSLYDKDGNLEVLPSRLYGVRRNLTTIRDSKALTQEASDAATARHELGQVQTVMDRVIGSGSTGYSDVYLPQWAHFSRLIDQQTYLQSKTLGPGKVTGPNGNLTANGMQKLLEQVARDKKATGNNPAKTLTEDQLNEMIAIRNELAAMQHRDNLAKSHGSPTVKKAAAAARLGISVGGMSPEAIDAAIHTVLAKTTLGAGNVVYQYGVKPILEKRREGKATAIIEGTRNKLLRTDLPHE
jgi:hypothetical protein